MYSLRPTKRSQSTLQCLSKARSISSFRVSSRTARPSPTVCRHRIRRPSVRQASTASEAATDSISVLTRVRNVFVGISILALGAAGYFYITDTRASIHRWFVVPALRLVYQDAEDAHHGGTKALKLLYQFGLYPRERGDPDKAEDLSVEVFGHTLVNPIGTSGGIDKHADIPDPLFAIGPAIIEVGGVTPLPQDGNPKPRVFRLPSQSALINRYGLNSEGADHLAMRLRQRVREFANYMGFGYDAEAEKRVLNGEAGVPPGSLIPGRLMAVQIAKNKDTPEADVQAVRKDYVYCVDRVAPYADILVVNVSSPNTPGLRTLQQSGPLTHILKGVVAAAKQTDRKSKPYVMVKVSPDEDSDEQVAGICQAVWESGVDGVIVGNTTKQRPDPPPSGFNLPPKEERALVETGGYSGPQLFPRTVELVKKYRKLLDRPPPKKIPPETPPEAEKDEPKNHATITSGRDPAPQTDEERMAAIDASLERDKQFLKDPDEGPHPAEGAKQPPLQLPDRNQEYLRSISSTIDQTPPKASPPQQRESERPKVIFATGGITTGRQALEVLDAGASVAMVYTALVYGGVGTISRIKDELREEMKKHGAQEERTKKKKA